MKRNWSLFLVTTLILSIFLSGCSSSVNPNAKEVLQDSSENLKGKKLSIYCGAGMTKPFEEIANKFKEKTKCNIEVTYANAAQIQTQINTSKEGDLFIAGSADELKAVEKMVSDSKDLVKHIPVLAVKSGNPLQITGINDLTKKDVEVILGDYEATPIGKIAKKALTDASIFEKVNVVATTSTAPELINAILNDQSDAIIVWKENAKNPKIEVVDTKDLDSYIKTIPAASLTCSDNKESLDMFLKFLDSDSAKNIWSNYGYELLN